MEPIDLTPNQQRAFEELSIEEASAKKMFKTAMTHYTNICIELKKKENRMWKELYQIHGLNLNKRHKIDLKEKAQIVEMTEEEFKKASDLL